MILSGSAVQARLAARGDGDQTPRRTCFRPVCGPAEHGTEQHPVHERAM
jgi:hypothetical protein